MIFRFHKEKKILFILLLLVVMKIPGQESLLNKPSSLEKVKECLDATYNFSFRKAWRLQNQLSKLHPGHPAPDFLKGLIIYWQNFPLTPGSQYSEHFIDQMDRVIDLAGKMLEEPSLQLEGVFFDLFGRAFKAMYYADNGKAGKVIPDLRTMYINTIRGFDLKDDFIEFYFSTGLYNYYIEAYPEAHPIYKPIVSFMKEGNRHTGLMQLEYAINECVYLKAEALLFMSLIQLNYEANLKAASAYALKLHGTYPGNSYYWGHSIIILLHEGNFSKVKEMLKENAIRHDSFRIMIEQIAGAFMEEHLGGNLAISSSMYMNVLKMAEKYGNFGDLYSAIAYMGLSRIADKEHDESGRKRYLRLAESHTNYTYIIAGLQSVPR